jgi:glutamine synthetase
MAGLLNNLSALIHFLAPSHNSIKRIQPLQEVGVYKYWGVNNKEAPLNLLMPYSE